MNENIFMKIARRITSAETGNALDEFYDFYEDGDFTVKSLRRLIEVIREMLSGADAYYSCISRFDECTGYIMAMENRKIVSDSVKNEISTHSDKVKNAYQKYESLPEDDMMREKILYEYNNSLSKMLAYCLGYEKTCMNIFRNRYPSDEKNVRNLLDTINDSGNNILNKGAGK